MMNKKKLDIILADDSKAFVKAMMMFFESLEIYNIIGIYKNGKELVESPLVYKADLILSDIEMPEMNGIEAAKRLNLNYPHIPMIALTMHVDRIYLDQIIFAGFKGLIYKPDIYKSISDVIHKVLNNEISYSDSLNLKINNTE